MLRILLAVLLLSPTAAFAQALKADAPPPSYPAVPLLSTGTSIAGEPLRYPSGNAHVTASIVTIAPGARTIPHKHGVPMFAYILEGELTVDYGDKGKRLYKSGDALMEAMDVTHFAVNTGTTTMRLIAVYMGADGAKDVIPTP